MKSVKWIAAIAFSLVVTLTAVAQEVPKFEVPVGFSFVNVHPELSPITSFNIFGGGGGFVYNLTPLLGIKADFMGYTQGSGIRQTLINNGYTVAGQVNGNLFTYMFGPQIKKHTGKLQFFGQGLFGAAHSNTYAGIYNSIHGITTGSRDNNAFAMEWGLGLDIPVTRNIQLRPVEVDYLFTRFGMNGYTGNQNNFKYVAGLNFTFGNK